MKDKIYFEWHQPDEYIQYIENLSPKFFLIKLIEKMVGKKGIEALIEINEYGIYSNWKGIRNKIDFENIHFIEFDYYSIPTNKFKIINVHHYEDLENKIPDKSVFAVPDNFNLRELKDFFVNKGYEIEDKINV